MATNEQLLDRVREALKYFPSVEEKRMFGGVCFMVDEKLCICVNQHELLCRIDPKDFESALATDGVRAMKQGERTAKGYIFIHEDVLNHQKDFEYWVKEALAYNKIAKASVKRK